MTTASILNVSGIESESGSQVVQATPRAWLERSAFGCEGCSRGPLQVSDDARAVAETELHGMQLGDSW